MTLLYGAFIFPKHTKPSWLKSGSTTKLAKLLGPWLPDVTLLEQPPCTDEVFATESGMPSILLCLSYITTQLVIAVIESPKKSPSLSHPHVGVEAPCQPTSPTQN